MKTSFKLIKLSFLFILFSCVSNNIPVNYNKVNYLTDSREHPDIDFVYPDSGSEYMQKLKNLLPQEIYVGKNDYEIVLSVNNYVASLWRHNGWNVPKKNDPISILNEVAKGEEFRCVEYGIVTVGFLNSIGITARVVSLKTKDVETRKYYAGHVVAEAYLTDLKKWVMIDSNYGVVPAQNGNPLSIYELQQVIFSDGKIDELSSDYSGQLSTIKEYVNWIKAYLFYFNTVIEEGNSLNMMLVPIGATKPSIFQRKYSIGDMLYTHSLLDFYQSPSLNAR